MKTLSFLAFFTLAALSSAQESPWISKEETANIKARWPKNVPYGKLRFYRLDPLYQEMYSMRSVPYNDATPLKDHSANLAVSGGMDRVHGPWRSVKGMDLPGKIKVWKENADVRAFVLVPRWRWAFPEGTVAYDVLFNAEWEIFEVRTQTKEQDEWRTKVYKNLAKVPQGYAGPGATCASCHSQAGKIVDVPGRIYRHTVWGEDGRFSWRPFDDSGAIDTRWPVDVR